MKTKQLNKFKNESIKAILINKKSKNRPNSSDSVEILFNNYTYIRIDGDKDKKLFICYGDLADTEPSVIQTG